MIKIKKNKKPWPTRDAMQQVYELNLWGENGGEFYSGEGSHNPYIIAPYIKCVSQFLNSFEEPISICDLGCGDFNIGKEFVDLCKSYTAVDIVPELISRNKKYFKEANLSFQCIDIAKDQLPKADCVIIRQVLQHLSNNEIKQIVNKLPTYRYIILTEHLPEGAFVPNLDIISGQGIRIKKKSGVDLLAEPFNLKVKKSSILEQTQLKNHKGIISTALYEMF
ncbi:methyltransferase family protein [Nonlabens dokdonensis]|uniref:Glycosyl transferase n=2 Tax=Nonlabens dokdonensis TaxID=328515 RepID=L7W6F7_NONDD|nr:class I SAM-dependent methyltransferase [Nonlabens dokdonensis]AGC75351.1 glycosyl transferase [Nonlabens dokdonensis DSW-6]PZX43055.1 methyltransferase family protein [Nonlabens dokdonensis]